MQSAMASATSRGRRPLLGFTLLAAVLLIGLAVWWFAAAGDPHSGENGPTLVESPSEGPPERLGIDLAGAPDQGEAPRGAGAEAGTARAAVSAPSADSLAPSAPAPALRLVGRVVDGNAAGIAEARIEVRRDFPAGAQLAPASLLVSKSTQGDERGRFELELEERAPLEVEVRAPGHLARVLWVPEPLEIGADGSADSFLDLGDIELEAGVRIFGHVIDGRGVPVEGAEFSFEGEEAPRSLAERARREARTPLGTSDRGGRFSIAGLPAGWIRVRVDSPRHLAAPLEVFAPAPGGVLGPLEVRLEEGETIEGWVRGASAERLNGLVVRAMASTGGPTPADPLPVLERRASPAPDGHFELTGLGPDRSYRLSLVDRTAPVGASPWAGVRTYGPVVTASPGDRQVELEVEPAARIRLRAIDGADGEPVRVFRVVLQVGPVGFASSAATVLVDDAEGRALLEDVPRGAGQLSIEAPDHLSVRLPVGALAAGQELDLGEIELTRARAPALRVVAAEGGAPVAGARVRLRAAPGAGGPSLFQMLRQEMLEQPELPGVRVGVTGEDGGVRLAAPGPGPLAAHVVAPGFAPFDGEVEVLEGEGAAGIEIALQAEAQVWLRVVDSEGRPVPGAQILHRSPADERESGLGAIRSLLEPRAADRDGRHRHLGLEPGLHRWRAERRIDGERVSRLTMGSEQAPVEWAELELAPGERRELVLVLPQAVELFGHLRQGDSALAGATLSLRLPGQAQTAVVGAPRTWVSYAGGSQTRSDGRGAYRFHHDQPGTYLVVVTHPQLALPRVVEVELPRGATRLDVDLAGASLAGRVLDGAGQPIAGARLEARGELSLGGARPNVFESDGAGRFLLTGLPEGTPFQLEARRSGFVGAQLAVDGLASGERREGIELRLAPGADLEVHLVWRGPNPPAQVVVVTLVPEKVPGTDGLAAPRPQTASIGERVRFTGLVPGDWRVRVLRIQDSAELGSAAVRLAPSQTRAVDIELDGPR